MLLKAPNLHILHPWRELQEEPSSPSPSLPLLLILPSRASSPSASHFANPSPSPPPPPPLLRLCCAGNCRREAFFTPREAPGATPQDAVRVAPEPMKKARAAAVAEAEKEKAKKEKVVASFEELGVSEEVMEAVREMGIEVPTEIQGIGIPAVLEEKSVALGSHTGSDKTLAYWLPLVQVLFCIRFENGKFSIWFVS
ncbi:hypothetical protein VNO80_25547 [Phaseolus coccineus]|uniref:DEAD-box RNA helicase Q domain-containing protein n=1 Tax=Phaseolus coccineus TaxID=3886 RepID=A0AAN9LZH9_PHACN